MANSDEEKENLRKTIDFFDGPPFTKDQLVYDIEFSKAVISFLSRVHKDMLKRLSPNEDDLMKEAIKNLISFYKKTYNDITLAAINQLADDVLKLGGNYQTASEAVAELKREFELHSPRLQQFY